MDWYMYAIILLLFVVLVQYCTNKSLKKDHADHDTKDYLLDRQILSLKKENEAMSKELKSLKKENEAVSKELKFFKKDHADHDTKDYLLDRQILSLKKENEAMSKELDSLQSSFASAVDQKFIETVYLTRFMPQYESIPIFRDFSEIPLGDKRFMRSVRENMNVSNFQASALVTGESENTYHTSLTQCDCMDFQIKRRPCKHMYHLALELGLLIGCAVENNSYVRELDNREKQLDEKAERLEKEKSGLQKIKDSDSQSCPYLARLFTEYYFLQDMKLANFLQHKSPPSPKAAENVKALAREKRDLLQKLKLTEYQLNFYESLFPWLLDFKEVSPQEAASVLGEQTKTESSEYSHFQAYLSPIEFNSLPRTERLQLSLDRYRSRNKTNWDVGIEYERYIGYLYEKDGHTVTYSGAMEGLKDMGRDLIVRSRKGVELIQCKRWAQEKIIHEKHIFQLYGSVVLYQIQNPKQKVSGSFYTTTTLSDTAKECAEYLGIV